MIGRSFIPLTLLPPVLPPPTLKGFFMSAISVIQSALTMSSREISDLIDKSHSNIKISAERLSISGVIGTLATQEFIHNGNKYTEYLFNKRDSLILVAQNSPEFTAAIVDRWQELETKQPENPLLQLAHAVMTAQGIIQDQSQKLLIAEPKAAALDLISDSSDSRCIRDTAKELQIKPSILTKYLLEHRWVYRQSRDDAKLGKAMAFQHRIDQGLIKHCLVPVTVRGQTKLATSVEITGKGLAKLAIIFAEKK